MSVIFRIVHAIATRWLYSRTPGTYRKGSRDGTQRIGYFLCRRSGRNCVVVVVSCSFFPFFFPPTLLPLAALFSPLGRHTSIIPNASDGVTKAAFDKERGRVLALYRFYRLSIVFRLLVSRSPTPTTVEDRTRVRLIRVSDPTRLPVHVERAE